MVTHNMSANVCILRKIDELSDTMSGDGKEDTGNDKHTAEKLSVAL